MSGCTCVRTFVDVRRVRLVACHDRIIQVTRAPRCNASAEVVGSVSRVRARRDKRPSLRQS